MAPERSNVVRCRPRAWSCNLLSVSITLIVLASLYFLATIGALLLSNSITNGSAHSTLYVLFTGWRDHLILQQLTTFFSLVDLLRLHKLLTRDNHKSLGDYECVGW